jgi:hypothetical protein
MEIKNECPTFFLLSPHAQNLFTMLPPREVHEHQQEQKHHKQDAADPGLKLEEGLII